MRGEVQGRPKTMSTQGRTAEDNSAPLPKDQEISALSNADESRSRRGPEDGSQNADDLGQRGSSRSLRRSMRAMSTTRSVPGPEQSPRIKGLTDPYTGTSAALRCHAYGHTFRWVRGDRYIGVQRGTCIDGRRVLVIRDHLDGESVLDGHQPVIQVIPVNPACWDRPGELRRIVDMWATARHLDAQQA